jgi:hypothetical protein
VFSHVTNMGAFASDGGYDGLGLQRSYKQQVRVAVPHLLVALTLAPALSSQTSKERW